MPLQIIEPYVSKIENLVAGLNEGTYPIGEICKTVEPVLNGELSKTLRDLVLVKTLRSFGAFFTAEHMADKMVASLPIEKISEGCAFDPSCGGGNLLLAFARQLPIEETWKSTLHSWGARLKGFDIHEPFVRATRARLALFAVHRGLGIHGKSFLSDRIPSLVDTFPHIQTQDSLVSPWPKADIVLLNPPFNIVPVPDGCNWATGRVSLAPVFLLRCLEDAEQGALIRAILPDVLRSGSRYKRWIKQVESRATVEGIDVLGAFDSDTAVDVFLLKLETGILNRPSGSKWWEIDGDTSKANTPNDATFSRKSRVVGDKFKVRVGRVVPHRDHEDGSLPLHPYFDLAHTPAWKTVHPGIAYRRYNGTLFEPPFVLIRRTSRAKDAFRAVGTLVLPVTPAGENHESDISSKVAVENHLMVALPYAQSFDDRLAACQALIHTLRDPKTSHWLNSRIRCRHLTVDSVSSIPFNTSDP